MFRFGKDDFKLIDGLVTGDKTKRAKKWNSIYNIMKFFGIAISGFSLACFGVTTPFVIAASSVFVALLGVRQIKVIPTRNAKANEDLAKQNLMLKIQSYLLDSDVVIDGKSFVLERVATINTTKPVIVREVLVSDEGQETVKENEIMKDGAIENYIRCSDNRNGLLCFLKNVRSYVMEQQVTGVNKFETRYVARNCAYMLEDNDVASLSNDVIDEINAYDGSELSDIQGVARTKKRF